MRPRNTIKVIVEVDPSAEPRDMEAVAKGFVDDLLGDTQERLQRWADEVYAEIARARHRRPVEEILREARETAGGTRERPSRSFEGRNMSEDVNDMIVGGPPSEADVRALVDIVEFGENPDAVAEHIRIKALDLARSILGPSRQGDVESVANEIGALAFDAYMIRDRAVEVREDHGQMEPRPGKTGWNKQGRKETANES